ncbi:MAG: hypothetical protein AAFX03_07595 [Pseudomonadota bacterium]
MDDSRYERSRYADEDNGLHRFGRWLARRPAENWMFFAAGLFFGGLFF